jgi:hypothetical protein
MAMDFNQLNNLIKTHKTRGQHEQKELDRNRRFYQGRWQDDMQDQNVVVDEGETEEELLTETNYSFAFVDSMVANVCPTNPRISTTSPHKESKEAARYREALVNETFFRGKTHEKLWSLATKSSVYPRSFLKALWNARTNRPIFRVLDPRNVWFDRSTAEWDDIKYIIEVVVLDKAAFAARVEKKQYTGKAAENPAFSAYPRWLKPPKQASQSALDIFEWAIVYEVYDFTDPDVKFYHFSDTNPEPLYKGSRPYTFLRNPYSMLTFNENLEDGGGMSDVSLIAAQNDRLNELDSLQLQHVQASIPQTIFNKSASDDPAAFEAAISTPSIGGLIGVSLGRQYKLSDLMATTPTPSLEHSWSAIRASIEGSITFTLGLPDFDRGKLGADVATEVALADSSRRTRLGRRQRKIYDIMAWMAESIVSLYEQFLADGDELPVRLAGRRTELVDREMLDFRPKGSTEPGKAFYYEAIPYSAMENNRVSQLKRMQENWPVLQELAAAGMIDNGRLADKLLELMLMPDLRLDEEEEAAAKAEAQAAQAPPGAPDMGAMPAPMDEEAMATGGLPDGLEEPPPVDGAFDQAGGPGNGGSGGVARGMSAFPSDDPFDTL